MKTLLFWFSAEMAVLILYFLSLIYIPAAQEQCVPSIVELFQKRIQISRGFVYGYV